MKICSSFSMLNANMGWIKKNICECEICKEITATSKTIFTAVAWWIYDYDYIQYNLCHWCYKTVKDYKKIDTKFRLWKYEYPMSITSDDMDILKKIVLDDGKSVVLDDSDAKTQTNFINHRANLITEAVNVNQYYSCVNTLKLIHTEKASYMNYLNLDCIGCIISWLKNDIHILSSR